SCLGIIRGSHCPHYDGEENRRPAYQQFIQAGTIGSGFAADDGVGLHFIDEELHRVVSSRPNAQGYRVDKDKETKLPTVYLGL
ncbi:MAG TPA: Type 1 glutamine amidotransferase-like domain-containing protein, partial [Paenisporosarcina sp.]|nr:Type 1 glutamine amidotransferase-like domain-containing protein [Paenisporosarcina sp.]